MGMLIEGTWHDVWYDTKATAGHFRRGDSTFRNWVTADGSAGPTGRAGFKAEADRYHLYVSYACPWAHRTLIFRKLKGLEDLISVSVVDPLMLENGWEFHDRDGATIDHLFGSRALWEIYVKADPAYSGRVTVPVLWDKQTGTIVSNESSEIIRMFNSAFNCLTGNTLDFYPEILRGEIDELNKRVYDTLNNGVYKSGFATTQAAYESAVYPLFETLDWLEERLATQRYLFGNSQTEADWRLFTTLVRSTLSMSATSSAISAGSRIIRTCPPTSAISTRRRAWRRRSTCATSRTTITAATRPSTRPALCRPAPRSISIVLTGGKNSPEFSDHQISAGLASPLISARRLRVAVVVWAGRSWRSKKPDSAISRSGGRAAVCLTFAR